MLRLLMFAGIDFCNKHRGLCHDSSIADNCAAFSQPECQRMRRGGILLFVARRLAKTLVWSCLERWCWWSMFQIIRCHTEVKPETLPKAREEISVGCLLIIFSLGFKATRTSGPGSTRESQNSGRVSLRSSQTSHGKVKTCGSGNNIESNGRESSRSRDTA